jgi:hypothetical protein
MFIVKDERICGRGDLLPAAQGHGGKLLVADQIEPRVAAGGSGGELLAGGFLESAMGTAR